MHTRLDPVSPGARAEQANGADTVIRALEGSGIEVAFGIPGGAALPLFDALARGTSMRYVLARHEQGAGHMAQGYARATGQPAAIIATSGPGATNLVTPIADAKLDSTPLVCVTGQVRSELIGTDAFQECDIVSVVRPLVKGGWQVRDPASLASTMQSAIALAVDGRPGPVLVDVPRDVQEAAVVPDCELQHGIGLAPHAAQPPGIELADADDVINDLLAASRPVLYVGGGAQGCASRIRELAEKAGVPVVTTLLGKGAFPESHPLFVGWPGMHGTKAANWTLHHADLIVAAGARFDDRVTGRVDRFAPGARVIHIDVDARELGKIRRPDTAIHAHLDDALAVILERLSGPAPPPSDWLQQIADWQDQFPLGHAEAKPWGSAKPQEVLSTLAEVASHHDEVIWTTGVGQHQMWAMQYLQVERPRTFITSGGLGTMGFGFPAAIGAAIARPQAAVVCVDGDGSFQMTLQELATAVAENVRVIVVILNNAKLGMVDQWQSMFYGQRTMGTDLRVGMPRFSELAHAYGAYGSEVRTLDDLRSEFAAAMRRNSPSLLDVIVDPDEGCFPMILPGGAAVDQMEWFEWRDRAETEV